MRNLSQNIYWVYHLVMSLLLCSDILKANFYWQVEFNFISSVSSNFNTADQLVPLCFLFIMNL